MTTNFRLYPSILQATLYIGVTALIGCQSLPSDDVRTTAASENPEAVSETKAGASNNVVRATPYYLGGEHLGYRLSPLTEDGSFEAFGLQKWDLLLEVEGRPLLNQDAVNEFLGRLDRGESVIARIDRDGEIAEFRLGMK